MVIFTHKLIESIKGLQQTSVHQQVETNFLDVMI